MCMRDARPMYVPGEVMLDIDGWGVGRCKKVECVNNDIVGVGRKVSGYVGEWMAEEYIIYIYNIYI